MSENRNVDSAQVRHMARLSRLLISEREEEIFVRQFNEILGHMAILEKLDTSQIEPLYTPFELEEITREDHADNIRSRKEILANAPETDGEFFIVPRIV